jgi:hypothetical protein
MIREYLCDNSRADVIRFAFTTAREIPGGWVQEHSWNVGETVKVTVWVWGEPMDEIRLETLVNQNLIFGNPHWR